MTTPRPPHPVEPAVGRGVALSTASTTRPSEEALALAAAHGDPLAFEQLVNRHHRYAYRSALRVLGNQDDATTDRHAPCSERAGALLCGTADKYGRIGAARSTESHREYPSCSPQGDVVINPRDTPSTCSLRIVVGSDYAQPQLQ